MSEQIASDGAYMPRSALGDVTNQVGKRGFSSINKKDEVLQIAKKQCVSVEGVLRPQSCSEIVCEIKEPCPPDVRQNATSTFSATVEAVGDVCESTQLVPAIPLGENGPFVMVEAEEDERTDSAVISQLESNRMVEDNLGMEMDGGNDVSLDDLVSSKDENLDCSRFPESQESRCDVERCIGQKGDGVSTTCMEMIKTCPCSFCIKAAYLWSDLHCQDIKGRIAAIKRSQKGASILVHQNSRDGARNVGKGSNLESDLTGRWKSLFLRMEDIFVREGTQLETSLSTMNKLVDDCKTNAEKN